MLISHSFLFPSRITNQIDAFADDFGAYWIRRPIVGEILSIVPVLKYAPHLFEESEDSSYVRMFDSFLDYFEEQFDLDDTELQRIWQFIIETGRQLLDYEEKTNNNVLSDLLFKHSGDIVRIELSRTTLYLELDYEEELS